MREYLDEQEENSDDDGGEADPYDNSSPVLLLGLTRTVTKQEMLADIPARSIADRLVSRFLKTSEPSLGTSTTDDHLTIYHIIIRNSCHPRTNLPERV